MAQITMKGNPVSTVGILPTVGQAAPAFTLTKTDLTEISLSDFKGQKLILSIFPSVDTPTCAVSTRKFNEAIVKRDDVVVLCVSADLPFAHKRFCGAEGLQNVIPASTFRHAEFGKNYGVTIAEGMLSGLLSRAIVAIDTQGQVIYTQQVAELGDEPNYQAVLNVIN